jgi:uncharacterized protein (DUF1015 family)
MPPAMDCGEASSPSSDAIKSGRGRRAFSGRLPRLMAVIAPFRALRFDAARFPDLAQVIAPPYDVISEPEREALERRHDRNIVRLDLPRGEGEAKYENARRQLDQWVDEGSLRLDPRPAIYRYEQTFQYPPGGARYVRTGFIANLQLTPFGAGVVLPHEHTLSGPKLDRQKLIRSTRAHFSQIFTLYRDPAGDTEAALTGAASRDPEVDTTTPDGTRHRLWVITDPEAIAQLTQVMSGKQVMIADGHHRYETMVSLRDELRPAGAAPGRAGADWGTVFFARAEDPGLLVLPTHRMVKNVPAAAFGSLREAAAAVFEVVSGSERTAQAIENRLTNEGHRQVTLALREPGRPETCWLRLRPDADLSLLGSPALRALDVTVLHGLILGPLLGIDKEAMAKQSFLSYTHDTAEALARVESGQVQGAFFMNPTKVNQVLTACEAGFVLPQKSTYFQPKLATGLVMARIEAQIETLAGKGPG